MNSWEDFFLIGLICIVVIIGLILGTILVSICAYIGKILGIRIFLKTIKKKKGEIDSGKEE